MVVIKCRLKVILAERGIKQKWLADKAGINKSTLSLLVNGNTMPTLEVAYKIANALELNVMDIWVEE